MKKVSFNFNPNPVKFCRKDFPGFAPPQRWLVAACGRHCFSREQKEFSQWERLVWLFIVPHCPLRQPSHAGRFVFKLSKMIPRVEAQ